MENSQEQVLAVSSFCGLVVSRGHGGYSFPRDSEDTKTCPRKIWTKTGRGDRKNQYLCTLPLKEVSC